MTKVLVMSLALVAMTATSYGADRIEEVSKDPSQTYTYVVGMSGVT